MSANQVPIQAVGGIFGIAADEVAGKFYQEIKPVLDDGAGNVAPLGPENPMPTNPALLGVPVSGQNRTPGPVSPAPLTVRHAVVQALASNAKPIYLGGPATANADQGFPLAPGASIEPRVADLNQLHFAAATDDGLAFLAYP